MQRGTIKEVKEIAKEGKKTFYEVIFQDDAKATTFDAKIKQADFGDTLEFEVSVAGKYINLRDGWKLTKQTSSSEEGKPSGNGYQMSKEEWAEKQRIERASIESQKRADIIHRLWVAEKLEKDDPLVGKLLSWLHKLEDNQTSTKAIKQAPEKELFTEEADQTTAESEPIEDKAGFIDMEWLKESLKTLQDKKLKGWSESNLLLYMKTTYKVEAKTVLEGAANLDEGKATHFCKKIQDTLDMV